MFGDSLAFTLGMGLSIDSVRHYGVKEWSEATLGCDLDPTLTARILGQVQPAAPGCPAWRTTWPAKVAADRPQVVVIFLGRWETVDHFYAGQWTWVGQPLWDRHVIDDLVEAIRLVSAHGARVVLFTLPYSNPPVESADGTPYPENNPARVDAYNADVRAAVRRAGPVASVVDLYKILDPGGHYQGTFDGVAVRTPDAIHFTLQGGEWLQARVLPALAAAGLAAAAAGHPPPR